MKLKNVYAAVFSIIGSMVFAQPARAAEAGASSTPVPEVSFPATPTPAPPPAPLSAEGVEQHFLPREFSTSNTAALALVYNGNRRSQIGPCGCKTKQLGGIDKEARLIELLKEKNVPTVAVDAGGYMKDVFTDFDVQRTKAALKIMGMLSFDALNVAYTDLGSGVEKLKDEARGASVPLVSANIVGADDKPVFEPYRVHSITLRSGEEVKVGFIGVTRPRLASGMAPRWTPTPAAGAAVTTTSATALKPQPGTGAERDRTRGSEGAAVAGAEAYNVADPVEALKKYIPELKEKSDVIVLLSYGKRQAVKDQIKALGELGKEIDVAVAGEYTAAQTTVETEGSTRIVSGGYEGRQVGLLLAEVVDGEIKQLAQKFIEIEQSIPSVEQIKNVVTQTTQVTTGQIGGAAGH